MPYYIMYLPTASLLWTYSQRDSANDEDNTVYMTEDYIELLLNSPNTGYKRFNFAIVSAMTLTVIEGRLMMLNEYLNLAKGMNRNKINWPKYSPGVFTGINASEQFGKQLIEHFEIVEVEDEKI
jgi:hypothetical protein